MSTPARSKKKRIYSLNLIRPKPPANATVTHTTHSESLSLTSRLGLYHSSSNNGAPCPKRLKSLSFCSRVSSSSSSSRSSDAGSDNSISTGGVSDVEVIISRPFSASSLSGTEMCNPNIASAQNPMEYLSSITSYSLSRDEMERVWSKRSGCVDGYTMEVIRAIQSNDLGGLRAMLEQGQTMQCCNRFGESILHMACRRGFVDIVKFLVHEANVEVDIADDYGRTPMHDAFWACEPNYDLVDILVKVAPQLLFVTDKRNHTPLQYARRLHWADWNRFFKERKPILVRSLALGQ